MKLISVPYTQDITPIFNCIARFPWSIWLDSGSATEFNQKYDIITSFPYKTITANINNTIVKDLFYNQNLHYINSSFNRYNNNYDNPFDILNNLLSKRTKSCPNIKTNDIPFWHGAAGYFGYDLNQVIFKQLAKQKYNPEIPILAVGIYAWALVYDHEKKQGYIAYDQDYINSNIINNIIELFSLDNYKQDLLSNNKQTQKLLKDFFKKNNFQVNKTKQEYENSYNKIKQNITDGDCYQVNYAMPFKLDASKIKASSWEIYQHLKQYNANPFGCYFNINNNLSVLSYSPERFLKITDNHITSEPIKGTRPNISNNPELNNQIKQELYNNNKDRAENIMITDLMRNDLNKYSDPGTVITTNICELHSFPTVHHLISTINGKLSSKHTSIDLLKGCFPGGSITGAPKIKAMQIIQDLENTNNYISRYAYCGSIGYININQNMDMNIAIRTSMQYKQNYYYWAGGGIVADSDNNKEFEEVYSKLLRTSK